MLRELSDAGFGPIDEGHARLYAPAGLDIGADSSQEIALAIIAEMRAVLAGRGGGSLRRRRMPIHDSHPGRLDGMRDPASCPDGRAVGNSARAAISDAGIGDTATGRPVGVLLLAAGASRRLGVPKQLLPFAGESLLRRAAQTALALPCRPAVVVLGAHRKSVESEIADLPLEIAVNEQWGLGMASSIRAGMDRLIALADTCAVIVMLCDQPRVDAALIEKMLAAYRRTNGPLVACRYNGTHGVPALFDRKLYPALLGLAGAKGAKNIIRAHAEELVAIDAPEAAYDIDTLADYRRLHAAEDARI